ncbi:TonB family protein [bacterium]|nr:TonB family protein [bacterium]
MKKHRFLIIAIALSILLHLLVFIFAPELKSEINPSDYLKKITKISIFHEPQSAPKQESAPTVPEPPKSSNSIKKRTPRNNEITESRNPDSNSAPRDNEITESRNNDNNNAPRDNEISESRDPGSNSAPLDNGITESRNIGTGSTPNGNTGEPRREGELAVIPKAKNPKTPPYPESLEEEGIEGSVTLELLISKEGKVMKAKVIKSDNELFSESALKTVKNYKFSPGKLKDGSEVDSLIEFVIKFEISL